MKFQYILFAFFLCFMAQTASAQGIGLNGKKVSIFYNLDYHGGYSSWSNMRARNNFFEEDNYIDGIHSYYDVLQDEAQSTLKTIINFRHSFQVDYALKRGLMLGGFLTLTKDGYGIERSFDDYFIISGSRNYKSTGIGAQFKFFNVRRRGGIAPLGNYFGLKMGLNFTRELFIENPAVYSEAQTIEGEKYTTFGIGLVGGKQSILVKNVMINIGCELNFHFNLPKEDEFSAFFEIRDSAQRLIFNDLLRLTIGFGYAPI